MFEKLSNNTLKLYSSNNNPLKKIFVTLLLLFLFRFGNSIPLMGLDQEALKKSFLLLDNKNSLFQIINMYSGGGGLTVLNPFSLGIIPFINASILIDLLTTLIPTLEKLQNEEGENGKKKLNFYKKVLTLLFGLGQSIFLISYLKNFLFDNSWINYFEITLELICGSLIIVWLTNIIDSRGIGNGTSLIIFTNIIVTLINKNILTYFSGDLKFFFELLILLFLMIAICISQTARININVVSARQLAYLETGEKKLLKTQSIKKFSSKENGLSIRFNQAGIFPIIIASNLLPFFSYLTNSFITSSKYFNTFIYYLLIIGFNYFYTIIFWDPEKISEQLRKASVSIVNITPGKQTISYLENVVRSTSLLGGIILCFILFIYDFLKEIINSDLFTQINISSLIILVGVGYEIQKTIRALYRSRIETQI